jgi:hypothetical protein
MMLEGVVGREGVVGLEGVLCGEVDIADMPWNGGFESGEAGRRRPTRIDELREVS